MNASPGKSAGNSRKNTTDNWQSVRRRAVRQLTGEIVDFINEGVSLPHPESRLIAVLHRVQDHFGYLGEAQLDAVAQLMQIPHAKVAGVASFYHYFRLNPRGKMIIRICMGTACFVKGAERVAEKFKEELGIDFGETTRDGMFSLESSRCLGTCGLAPVIMVEDQVHGYVTPDQVPGLIEKLLQQAKRESKDHSA